MRHVQLKGTGSLCEERLAPSDSLVWKVKEKCVVVFDYLKLLTSISKVYPAL